MSNKIVNSLLVISALAFVSLLTGCGKSKETKSNPATPPPAEQGTQGNGGRPTTRVPGQGDGTKAPIPVTPPDRSQPPIKPPVKPPTPPPVGEGPKTPAQPQLPPNLPESNERVNFEGTVVKTGGLKSAGERSTEMYYTGSSNDQLLETLLISMNFKSDAERSVDMQIARDIKFAKLNIEKKSGKRVLSISTDEVDTKMQIFQLIESDQNANFLLPVKRDLSAPVGHLEAVSAELICMDATVSKNANGADDCLVTVAKVQFANGQANIIFRKNHALADAEFVLSDKDVTAYNANELDQTGLGMWLRYVSNRVDQVITIEKAEKVIVSSYEIVGGKSEMGVLITAADGASAGIRVPLLAGLKGSTVNANSYMHNHIDNKFDFSSYSVAKKVKSFNLGNVVHGVKLVKNNGRGDVMLSVTFDQRDRNQEPEDQSRMNLVISRNNTPVDLNKLTQTVN